MWKKLFAEHGAKDVVTLFHSPSISSSNRVLTILKQHRANAAATATEDQASSTAPQASNERAEFDLDIREEPPTEDQLKSILEYVGSQNAGEVVKGAQTDGEAFLVFGKDKSAFVRPLLVDWHQGKVVVGDNTSKIMELIKAIKKPE